MPLADTITQPSSHCQPDVSRYDTHVITPVYTDSPLGIVSSDLGRVYKTNFAMVLAVGVFTSVIAKPTEGGARSLVLATLTSTEENGKYITHYQSDEDYKV